MIQSTIYPESTTEKDRRLIQLLIEHPTMTNAKIAKLLGVSRQAVSERRKKLEHEGVIKSYVFWNIVPKLGLIKEFEIRIKDASDRQIEELIDYLAQNWKVVFVWLREDRKSVSGVILTEKETPFVKVVRNEFPFVSHIRLRSIEFKKFLGRRIMTEKGDVNRLHEIAYKEALRLSKRKSVIAVLYSTEPQTNSLNLVVLIDKRFHPYTTMTSTDKMCDNNYVHIRYSTYKILKRMIYNRGKGRRIRNLRILFARNNRDERRIRYLLRLAQHI